MPLEVERAEYPLEEDILLLVVLVIMIVWSTKWGYCGEQEPFQRNVTAYIMVLGDTDNVYNAVSGGQFKTQASQFFQTLSRYSPFPPDWVPECRAPFCKSQFVLSD
jgi:hypothetical protein